MKVALVLLVALACVALASAGGKYKKGKQEGKEGGWEGGKKHKKEGYKGKEEVKNGKYQKKESWKKQDGKRTKRDEQAVEEEIVQEDQNQEQVKQEKGKRQAKPVQEESKQKKLKKEKTQTKKEEAKPAQKRTKEEVKPQKIKKEEVKQEEQQEDVIIEVEEPTIDGECRSPQEECSGAPEVELPSGSKVKGRTGKSQNGRETAEFTSVPYGEQEGGSQGRFKESVLLDNWPGVWDATGVPNSCLQYSHFSYSLEGSEDCLYLNIYTPQLPKRGDNGSSPGLPVVAYIHGGAFMFFSGYPAGPKFLMDLDIVLVTINYRLGPLGFLSLGDDSVPGNLGLRDQNLALQWIQKNIAPFGGDPKRVTITGMSAGGASVHYHLLSPKSKGLFERAISISGSSLTPWAEAESLKEKSMALAASLGCLAPTSQEILRCLRSRPAESIVSFIKEQQVWQYNPISPWAPSPEPQGAKDPFLPSHPNLLMDNGAASDVPWLVSFTDKEGLYPAAEFVFDEVQRSLLEKQWNQLLPHLLEYNHTVEPSRMDLVSASIRQFYLKDIPASSPQAIPLLTDMVSDRLFLEGIKEAALGHAKHYKSPVFAYRFRYKGQDSVSKCVCHCDQALDGACHADDVGYFFNTFCPVVQSPEDLRIMHRMVQIWNSFIYTGKPEYDGMALPEVDSSGKEGVVSFLDIGIRGEPRLDFENDLGNSKLWRSLAIGDLSHRSAPSPVKDEL